MNLKNSPGEGKGKGSGFMDLWVMGYGKIDRVCGKDKKRTKDSRTLRPSGFEAVRRQKGKSLDFRGKMQVA